MKPISWLFALLLATQCYAQRSDFDTIDFKRADSIALAYKDGLENLPALSHRLTATLNTDVEKFRAIYIWVTANIANDYRLYHKNHRKRYRFKDDSLKLQQWNSRFNDEVFQTLLKKERTICTGYAYLVKELATLAGITCEIVNGYGRTSTINIEKLHAPNHSWNAVQLNDKWYLCDPTWASGIPNTENFSFEFDYNDGYFLANPQLFAINHYPEDTQWFLLEQPPTFEEFLDAPVLYGNAYQYLEATLAPTQMHHRMRQQDTLELEYLLKAPLDPKAVQIKIDNGQEMTTHAPTHLSLDQRRLSLQQQFHQRGFYDVHLLFENQLIATYTVEVVK